MFIVAVEYLDTMKYGNEGLDKFPEMPDQFLGITKLFYNEVWVHKSVYTDWTRDKCCHWAQARKNTD